MATDSALSSVEYELYSIAVVSASRLTTAPLHSNVIAIAVEPMEPEYVVFDFISYGSLTNQGIHF